MTGIRRCCVGLVLLVLTALLVLADAPAPPSRIPPSAAGKADLRPVAVVSLGDSTLAGEGAGDYLPGTRGENGNFCHRSAHAVVQRIMLPGVTRRINLACSGAGSANIGFNTPQNSAETSQAARLGELARQYRVGAVVIAVGANDGPSFADVVMRCAQAWVKRWAPPCSADLAVQWPARVAAMVPDVTAAVVDVRTAMRGAGYRDGAYDLVLQSYPAPLTERLAPELQDLSGCPFRTQDLIWLRTVAVPQLSGALRGVADRTGARFLDLTRAAEGHEACTSPADPGNEWVTRLSLDFARLRNDDTGLQAVQESFHPNALGHDRIAGCLSEFLQTDERESACQPNPVGRLQTVRLPAASR
ncbi:MAG: GDSL-type esterase/lipase family protein [Pseudonocardiaceae bacterium]